MSTAESSHRNVAMRKIIESLRNPHTSTFQLLHTYWWQRYNSIRSHPPSQSFWDIHSQICDDFEHAPIDGQPDRPLPDELAEACATALSPQNRHAARHLGNSTFWQWDLFSVCAIFGQDNCSRYLLDPITKLSDVFARREEAMGAMLQARHERLMVGKKTTKTGEWRKGDIDAARGAAKLLGGYLRRQQQRSHVADNNTELTGHDEERTSAASGEEDEQHDVEDWNVEDSRVSRESPEAPRGDVAGMEDSRDPAQDMNTFRQFDQEYDDDEPMWNMDNESIDDSPSSDVDAPSFIPPDGPAHFRVAGPHLPRTSYSPSLHHFNIEDDCASTDCNSSASPATTNAMNMKRRSSSGSDEDAARENRHRLRFQQLSRDRQYAFPLSLDADTPLTEWLKLFSDHTTVLTAPVEPTFTIREPARYCIVFPDLAPRVAAVTAGHDESRHQLLAVALLHVEPGDVQLDVSIADDVVKAPSKQEVVKEAFKLVTRMTQEEGEDAVSSEEQLQHLTTFKSTSAEDLTAAATLSCCRRAPFPLHKAYVHHALWTLTIRAAITGEGLSSLATLHLPSAATICRASFTRFGSAAKSRRQTDYAAALEHERRRRQHMLAELDTQLAFAEGSQQAVLLLLWVLGRLLEPSSSSQETAVTPVQQEVDVRRRMIEVNKAASTSATSATARGFHDREVERLEGEIAQLEGQADGGHNQSLQHCFDALQSLAGHFAFRVFEYEQEMERLRQG